MQAEGKIHVNAPPEKIWALISDVTRMGEWSPETYKAEWIEGATGPVEGARFKGSNKKGIMRWSTKVRVLAAEPGQEFSFVTMAGQKDQTRWSYKFVPATDGGTDVTEVCETLYTPAIGKLLFPDKRREPQLNDGIRATLGRLKTAAEGSA
jgi:uncharacterized protein YndB with AHSA1/START domain